MNVTSASIAQELTGIVIETLNLELSADSVDADAPLFGAEGLGLDSIDMLEIALEISKRYGFQLRSDDENNKRIFASLNALARHVEQHRTK
ncbi:MAG: phosphopantetheine-binding protein [Burkholderiales bacterium]